VGIQGFLGRFTARTHQPHCSPNDAKRMQFRRLLVEPLEERKLLTVIDLAAIGLGGTTIYGADAGDNSGNAVSNAGDVNGDGYDDLIIGAYLAHSVGNSRGFAGESYLIFGKADWSSTPTIDSGSLGTAGVTIFGGESQDVSGHSVSGVGDVNGDGFDDFAIGAFQADGPGNGLFTGGDTYLIFGKADWSTTPSLDIANLGSAGVDILTAMAWTTWSSEPTLRSRQPLRASTIAEKATSYLAGHPGVLRSI
jgi:hypothetical protein